MSISFILHGKYSDEHLFSIDQYRKYGKIILVTYKEDIEKIKDFSKYDTVVLLDNITMEHYNKQNIYSHANSVNIGLYHCNTEYVVKLRLDEYYSNIKYFLDIVTNPQNKFKLTTTNIFFRKDSECKYHPSDHIVGGTKYIMEKAYSQLLHDVSEKRIKVNDIKREYAEMWLGTSLPVAFNEKVNSVNSKKIMKNYFQVADIRNMEPLCVSYNSNPYPVYKFFSSDELLAFTFLYDNIDSYLV